MKKIRVMIVEDSRTARRMLEHIISSDERLEVVSSVESGEDALRHLRRTAPDVVSMDIHLPGINGYETTRRIMEERPTPIVVVSGCVPSEDVDCSMRALKAGALSLVEKPGGMLHREYARLAERLCTQLAIMSQVKVVRQRFNRRPPSGPRTPVRRLDDRGPAATPRDAMPLMVGIVSSTGGPKALQAVLGDLTPDFPLPIVLVQHIAAGFHHGFVQWLDQVCPLRVVSADDGRLTEPGHVYVAPPDRHLHVDGLRLRLRRGAPVSSQIPSGTVLLESMAASLHARTLGVVLTGMGDDGAAGLAALRDAGGYTLAEDESTAVVYGMPAAAAQLGAVWEQLPLHEIGPRLATLAPSAAEAVR